MFIDSNRATQTICLPICLYDYQINNLVCRACVVQKVCTLKIIFDISVFRFTQLF